MPDEASLLRVINSLPEASKDKATSKNIAAVIFPVREKLLRSLVQTEQINPIYRYFNSKATYLSKVIVKEDNEYLEKECVKLPNDLKQGS